MEILRYSLTELSLSPGKAVVRASPLAARGWAREGASLHLGAGTQARPLESQARSLPPLMGLLKPALSGQQAVLDNQEMDNRISETDLRGSDDITKTESPGGGGGA